jgi:hypothetical protein
MDAVDGSGDEWIVYEFRLVGFDCMAGVVWSLGDTGEWVVAAANGGL